MSMTVKKTTSRSESLEGTLYERDKQSVEKIFWLSEFKDIND